MARGRVVQLMRDGRPSEIAAHVGCIAGDVDDSVGKQLSELNNQASGDDDLRPLLPERAEHRQADRTAAAGERYHDAEDDEAVAKADGASAQGEPSWHQRAPNTGTRCAAR